MDRGLWITWYNLPDRRRDAYLSWLHGVYIPKVLARPGVLWAAHYASEENVPLSGAKGRLRQTRSSAVPAGDRFILLFGAKDAHVFVQPTPREFHAQLSGPERKMLSLRRGERVNIMTEEARVYGPAARQTDPGMALSPAIQFGSFNSGSCADEDELAAWYARWRLPSEDGSVERQGRAQTGPRARLAQRGAPDLAGELAARSGHSSRFAV